jgi:hypothetical protein
MAEGLLPMSVRPVQEQALTSQKPMALLGESRVVSRQASHETLVALFFPRSGRRSLDHAAGRAGVPGRPVNAHRVSRGSTP